MGLFETLERRGYLAQVSDPGLRGKLNSSSLTLYAGFDPTADSLHLGHLVPIMALARFQRAGHQVLAVVGGATGMIGDPSGHSAERNLLTREQVEANVAGLKGQLGRFLRFDGPGAAKLLDNYDWISSLSFVDWLRDVGKHFPLAYMLAKDSVKLRLDSEAGISYTEFSYLTMQAYDFLVLHDRCRCALQVGGNDQWGNITAGIDLIRKVRGAQAYGLTFPLLTTASGEKFGKSAGNAVWLDAGRTSPYAFYQYWMRSDDRDARHFLMLFTFLEEAEVEALAAEQQRSPEQRAAQKRLALEATRLVHGEEAAERARRASEALFGQEISGLSDLELREAFSEAPSAELPRSALSAGLTLLELLRKSGACASNAEAKRLIHGGGAYLNNRRSSDPQGRVGEADLASESILVLRTGKTEYRLVKFV